MKIFSLQSKIGLVGWSVGFGFLINFIVEHMSVRKVSCGVDWDAYKSCFISGWPSVIGWQGDYATYDSIHFLYNLFFWILVVFIILFIVRFLRKKSVKIITNL